MLAAGDGPDSGVGPVGVDGQQQPLGEVVAQLRPAAAG